MFKILSIIFVALSFSVNAADEIFSVIVKEQKNANNDTHLFTHAFSIGSGGDWPLLPTNEFAMKATKNSSDEMGIKLTQWIQTKLHNTSDRVVILYDSESDTEKYFKKWKNCESYPDHLVLIDLHEKVRKSFKTSGSAVQRDLDARMQFLVHSSLKWQKRQSKLYNFTINAEAVRNLNFEQINAYYWIENKFQPLSQEKKVKYWTCTYEGKKAEADAFPGLQIMNDRPFMVGHNGILYLGDDTDGVIVDLQEKSSGIILTTVCTQPLIDSLNAGEWFWNHDSLESLGNSPLYFQQNLE